MDANCIPLSFTFICSFMMCSFTRTLGRERATGLIQDCQHSFVSEGKRRFPTHIIFKNTFDWTASSKYDVFAR